MNQLLSTLIQRPRTILMVLLLLVVAGIATYISAAKESSPNIKLPLVNVSVTLDGVSPEDAESLLVKPLENELRGLDNVKNIIAEAVEGRAGISIEFDANVDDDAVLGEVREKVDKAKSEFPRDADEPVVKQITAENSETIVSVVLSGNQSYRTLLQQARGLKKQLELVPQILEVELVGDADDAIDVEVNPAKIQSYNLNVSQVADALRSSGGLVSAGSLETEKGNLTLKIPTVFRTPEDVLSQPVVVNEDRVLLVRDIADVRITYKTPEVTSWLNGSRSVELKVHKKAGQNIFHTVEAVRVVTGQFREHWPSTTEVTYIGDLSEAVDEMISDLQNSILSSVALVVIILVASLGMRSALLVAVSIPVSFLTGIVILTALGHSVNMVVLFSLIMAVGMLVDGAIVVIELAQRKLAEGKSPTDAYIEASQQMAWPIIASTATTLSAFFPLLFWPGFFGEFMKYLPITLISTLTASLVVALIIVPTIGRLIDKPLPLYKEDNSDTASKATLAYMKILGHAINHPWKVFATGVILLGGIFYAYGQSGLGVEFFPQSDEKVITLIVQDDGSPYSRSEQQAIVDRVYQRVSDVEAIDNIQVHVGGKDYIGQLVITLIDWQYRPHSQDVADVLRERLADIPIDVSVVNVGGPQMGKPFQLEISGKSISELREVNEQIQTLMADIPELINVEDNGPSGGVEWELSYDKTLAAKNHVNVGDIGTSIKLLTNGVYLGAYRPDYLDEEMDIRLRLPEEQRHFQQLDFLTVASNLGQVPIAPFVTRTIMPRNDNITRVDGRQAITISADLKQGAQLNKVIEAFEPLIADFDMQYRFKGEAEDQKESGLFLVKAFTFAIFLMAIILVTQFNSYFQVSLILSAVVFSTGGVFIGLMWTGIPFTIVMSGIGIIALAGIVVNNNIVLIDTYNVLRREEAMEVREAVLHAVFLRLRPVMLTTITTILGLLPMAMGLNIDLFGGQILVDAPSSAVWTPLAVAIVAGLAFASVITLMITPCLLMIGESHKDRKLAKQDAAALIDGSEQSSPG
ncbi:Multidrug resistance protein MdtC [BD1-7 clade bacterium]|uniref:Multidrug resistance protein MdtC n=2 Tax=BD1-7 clade bacterium TaxID=2029982 RepID=A0A5S9PZ42_9GAMM|nr:Multidrug resistance protein MdtC [BD1-7 clade bacterium]